MDKDLPVNAGDTALIPGPGGLHMAWSHEAHASRFLSPSSRARVTAAKSRCHNYRRPDLDPVLCDERRHSSGKPGRCNEDPGQPTVSESFSKNCMRHGTGSHVCDG